MAQQYINRDFYNAIIHFDEGEEYQDYYYKIMDTETGRVGKDGRNETIRDQILRVYAMLFCEDMGAQPGTIAGPDEVEATADRLYLGSLDFDPEHWYRMQHHIRNTGTGCSITSPSLMRTTTTVLPHWSFQTLGQALCTKPYLPVKKCCSSAKLILCA